MGKKKSVVEQSKADVAKVNLNDELIKKCIGTDYFFLTSTVDPIGVFHLTMQLSLATNLLAQEDIINRSKGSIRKMILTAPASDSIAGDYDIFICKSIQLLVLFYSYPLYAELRKHFEWLIETVRNCKCINLSLLKNCITDICVCIWSKAGGDDSITANVDVTTDWLLCLNCLALFDIDFKWVDDNNDSCNSSASSSCNTVSGIDTSSSSMMRLSNDSYFYRLASTIDIILSYCISSVTNGQSASETIRYATCSGEVLRAAIVLFKIRTSCYIDSNDQKWESLADHLMQTCCAMLQLDSLHKDIVTQAAFMLVYLQNIFRYKHCNRQIMQNLSPHQLAVLLLIISDKFLANGMMGTDIEEVGAAVGIRRIIITSHKTFASISKCSLLRAALSMYDDDSIMFDYTAPCSIANLGKLMLSISLPDNTVASSSSSGSYSCTTSLLFSPIFHTAITVTNNSDALVQFFGLQILEAWFNRVLSLPLELYLLNRKDELLSVISKLKSIASLMLKLWGHPSKMINHMVPNVYQLVVNTLDSLPHVVSGSVSDLTNVQSVWDHLIADSLLLLPEHRGYHQSLRILLPKVGAQHFISLHPDIIETLIGHIKTRDVAASVSLFLGILLKTYIDECRGKTEEPKIAARLLWVRHIAYALCSDDVVISNNTSDYLLTPLFKLDEECGPSLIASIRDLPTGISHAKRVGAIMKVVFQARSLDVVGQDVVTDSTGLTPCSNSYGNCSIGSLTTSELYWACLSNDVDMRLLGLTVIVASQKTSKPMLPHELDVLMKTFEYTLKLSQADHRNRLCRVIKLLLCRLSESHSVSVRERAKVEKKRLYLLTQGKQLECDSLILEVGAFRTVIDGTFTTCRWLSDLLQSLLHPKCTSSFEMTVLEVMHCVFEVVGITSHESVFYSNDMTYTLLNLCISNWDKSRKLASDLLLRYFKHSRISSSSIEGFVTWGCSLAGSAKQRESEAGAFVLKSLYKICYFGDSDTCSDAATGTGTGAGTGTGTTCRHIQFLSHLCDTVDARMVYVKQMLSNACVDNRSVSDTCIDSEQLKQQQGLSIDTDRQLLCHGLLLTLRLCIDEVHHARLLESNRNDAASAALWNSIIHRMWDLSHTLLDIAMVVVAEAETDNVFAPEPLHDMLTDTCVQSSITTKGPISTSLKMAASYVNTNSVVGSSTCRGNDDLQSSADHESSVETQRAVVASWLLVKESTALLSSIVRICPPPIDSHSKTNDCDKSSSSDVSRSSSGSSSVSSDSSTNTSSCSNHTIQLLTSLEIAMVGNKILNALGRLKHMGAIAGAHESLQLIAETVLLFGDRCSTLCRLPLQWLQELLDRLELEQQVFILRRSAGFAYSFLSLLRSEPDNCVPTLLHVAMRKLLFFLRGGLQSSGAVDVDGACLCDMYYLKDRIGGTNSSSSSSSTVSVSTNISWKMAVHALNVLRLILVDAGIRDTDCYVSDALQLSIVGLTSSIWALRNSSMLLFAAVVQCAVDNDKNQDGGKGRCTIVDFFNRYPPLFPFLLEKLASISSHKVEYNGTNPTSVKRHMSADGNTKASKVNPSLFPILLLLGKFTPVAAPLGDKEGYLSKEADITLFLPLLMCCHADRSQHMREMAAKALSSILPLQLVASTSITILDAIKALVTAPESTSTANRSNRLHGYLAILVGIIGNLSSSASPVSVNATSCNSIDVAAAASGSGSGHTSMIVVLKLDLQHQLVPRLAPLCFSLISLNCPPIQRLLLQLLSLLHKYLPLCATSLKLLRYSYSFIVNRIVRTSHCKGYNLLPYASTVLKESISGYISMIVSPSPLAATAAAVAAVELAQLQSVILLVNHEITEVREAVIGGCLKCFDASSNAFTAFICDYDVIVLVVDAMKSEQEPAVLTNMLQLMCQVVRRLPCPSTPHHSHMQRLLISNWAYLLSLSHTSADAGASVGTPVTVYPTPTAAFAIEVLGYIVACILCSAGSSNYTHDVCVIDWLQLLLSASHEDQPVMLREGAARSASHSNALKYFTMRPDMSVFACHLWVISLTLMQDDDDDVRDCIYSITSSLVTSSSVQATDGPPHSIQLTASYLLDQLPTHIAASISSSRVNSDTLDIIVNEYKKLKGSSSDIESLLSCHRDDLIRIIFEAEASNLYYEKIATGKVVIRSVLLAAKEDDPMLASTVYQQVIAHLHADVIYCIQLLHSDEGFRFEWIGGLTYHGDVYRFIYLSLYSYHQLMQHFQDNSMITEKSTYVKEQLLSLTKKDACMHRNIQQIIELLLL